MALSYEGNTDLAFNTDELRQCGIQYSNIATDLRDMSNKLDKCINDLKSNGWTTPAGTAFYKMVNMNWRDNIEKYAALLDTLKIILDDAATQYESLVENNINKTKV